MLCGAAGFSSKNALKAPQKQITWLMAETRVQELERRRHLLRLWVAPPVDRPLPACYAELYGSVRVGDRGGIRCPGYEPTIVLEAE